MAGPLETKKERRRKRIHEAATVLLKEHGFSETRMRDIAQKADLAVGTLYNYYPSKKDLYMRILEEDYEDLNRSSRRELVNLVCTGTDLLEIFSGLLIPVRQLLTRYEDTGLSDMVSELFSSQRAIQHGAALDMELIAGLERIIKRLQRRSMIDPRADASAVAWNIYSVVGFTILATIFVPEMGNELFDQGIREQLRQLIDGIGVVRT
jgi:AcrR family transcriptional regulator